MEERMLLDKHIIEYFERNKSNENIPVYSVTNSLGFCKEYFDKEVASKDKKSYKIVPRGYFAYNPSRINVGSVDWQRHEEKVIVSPLYNIFRVDEYIYNQFLYYFLKSEIGNSLIKVRARGSVRDNLKIEMLREMSIPNISIDEQKKRAENLDKIQAIISKKKEQLEQLDILVQARFVEMFGDPSTNPKGYPVKVLPDIAEYWNGLIYKPEDVANEGTIVLRSSNIQNATLDFADTVRVSCKIVDKKYVQDNDILMCSRNGSARLVGKVALIKNIDEPMSFGAFMMIIRSVYYPYLMTYFQMSAFRAQITTGATTTINQITGRMLDVVKLPVPDLNVINEFAQYVTHIDKLKSVIQKSINTT